MQTSNQNNFFPFQCLSVSTKLNKFDEFMMRYYGNQMDFN